MTKFTELEIIALNSFISEHWTLFEATASCIGMSDDEIEALANKLSER